MWHQVQEIGKDLMNASAAHPEGLNFLGKHVCYFGYVQSTLDKTLPQESYTIKCIRRMIFIFGA